MNVTVDCNDETNTIKVEQIKLVKTIATKAIEMENMTGEIELSITFVTEERIQEMNYEYRDKNESTDVISFALNEQGEDELCITGQDLPNILGDVVISVGHIAAQAKEYGHSFERELGFLVAHGVLHLLGYGHMTEATEKEMFSRQEDILTAYGLTR